MIIPHSPLSICLQSRASPGIFKEPGSWATYKVTYWRPLNRKRLEGFIRSLFQSSQNEKAFSLKKCHLLSPRRLAKNDPVPAKTHQATLSKHIQEYTSPGRFTELWAVSCPKPTWTRCEVAASEFVRFIIIGSPK